jgi:hypothetical protein
LDRALVGVGTDHDDGDRIGAGVGAEASQYLVAVDVGQAQIQQYQVGVVVVNEVEAGQSSADRDELEVGPAFEDALDQTSVGGVVVDVEHGAVPQCRDAAMAATRAPCRRPDRSQGINRPLGSHTLGFYSYRRITRLGPSPGA